MQICVPGYKKKLQDQNVTAGTVAEKRERIINRQRNTNKIKFALRFVHVDGQGIRNKRKNSRSNPYCGCGGLYFKNTRPFQNIKW